MSHVAHIMTQLSPLDLIWFGLAVSIIGRMGHSSKKREAFLINNSQILKCGMSLSDRLLLLQNSPFSMLRK